MFDSGAWQLFFSQFHFLRPWWLVSFIPLIVIFYIRWQQDTKQQLAANLPEHLRKALTVGEQGWSKLLPLKLLMVIISLGVLVCAGPSWQREASPFGEDKAPLVIVLDTSESMLQTDLAPSRLERAKQKITDLVNLRDGGRTALVVYAGSAHVAMPLTKDKQVYLPFLSAIDPDVMPVKGKRAEQVLPLVDGILGQSSGASILLLTDGMPPQTLAAYHDYFQRHDAQLLIYAMGNTQRRAAQPLDMQSLNQLASETGGELVQVSVDDNDINRIHRAIERHMQLSGESAMPWEDGGYYLLLPIAVIMLLWFRKGWLVQWCLVACVLAAGVPSQVQAQPVRSTAQSESVEQVVDVSTVDKIKQWWMDLWFTPDQQGQRLFNQKHYLQAGQHYQDPLRRGIAYYYAGEFKLAHAAFLQDGSTIGLYYAASALARQREYIAARNVLQTLQQIPELNAELKKDITHNLNVIQGLIDEVNQQSLDQQGGLEQETSIELDENQPQTGDGADEQTSQENMLKQQLSAEQLLGDQALADKWLKRVEANPKQFLQAKFQLQLLDEPPQTDSEAQ